jgi:hypothetical protein
LDPVAGKGAELGRTAWLPTILGNWNVSPDGRMIALTVRNLAKPTSMISRCQEKKRFSRRASESAQEA